EAQVVADGQADPAPEGLADDDVPACERPRRLAVDDPSDVHVEEVELAVLRSDAAVREDEDARVQRLLLAGAALGHAPRRDRDVEAPRPSQRRLEARPVEGLRLTREALRVVDEGPLLGEDHEPRALPGRALDELARDRGVAHPVLSRGHLDRGDA